jgi:hypothetical protein
MTAPIANAASVAISGSKASKTELQLIRIRFSFLLSGETTYDYIFQSTAFDFQ